MKIRLLERVKLIGGINQFRVDEISHIDNPQAGYAEGLMQENVKKIIIPVINGPVMEKKILHKYILFDELFIVIDHNNETSQSFS